MGAESLFMKMLLGVIVSWLTVTTDLPVDDHHPHIVLVPAEEVAALRYPTVSPAFRPSVLAVYDDENGTIYLHDAWQGTSVADISVLVHEMVHHLQKRAGRKFACAGEREVEAYQAQERFLGYFGKSLERTFELDPMALKLMTRCLML